VGRHPRKIARRAPPGKPDGSRQKTFAAAEPGAGS
jgi:hypothetical protein